jgi:D-hydroxyproline dehydrogenase subunit gamma
MSAERGAGPVRITVDGRAVDVPAGATLAGALLGAGVVGFRSSVSGEPRAPLCGMGSCFECRVRVDGVAHVRACMEPVRDGMAVVTRD